MASIGIVGVAEWGDEVWIWSEAWPLLDRPFVTDRPAVRPPAVLPVADPTVRMPSIIAMVDHALGAWEANPPAVLKNGDARVAKTQVRATAKSIGSDETTVDLIGRLVIGVGLLLPLRPKADGGQAHFYSLVSDDTDEVARNRQRFLAEQGYSYAIVEAGRLDAGRLEA